VAPGTSSVWVVDSVMRAPSRLVWLRGSRTGEDGLDLTERLHHSLFLGRGRRRPEWSRTRRRWAARTPTRCSNWSASPSTTTTTDQPGGPFAPRRRPASSRSRARRATRSCPPCRRLASAARRRGALTPAAADGKSSSARASLSRPEGGATHGASSDPRRTGPGESPDQGHSG
jgi:hypothetical protein